MVVEVLFLLSLRVAGENTTFCFPNSAPGPLVVSSCRTSALTVATIVLPSVVEKVPRPSELVMVQPEPSLVVMLLASVIEHAVPPVMVRVFPVNVEFDRVRTIMLPSDTRIGEGRGAGGRLRSVSLRGHPLQPHRTILAQTGRIRPAYCRAPRVFGYSVFRMLFLLSSISGNHPQKGTPEPL